ncbi:MAG: hypothetical protein ACYCW6_10005 [Candidatus Xenobia bacterium]
MITSVASPAALVPVRRAESPDQFQNPALQTAADVATDAMYSTQAIPSFLYPSVFGTAAEKAAIWQTLDQLPMKDVGSISQIRMVPTIGNVPNGIILGVTRPVVNTISISRNGIMEVNDGQWNPDLARMTLIHETGHALDYRGGIAHVLLGGDSAHGPFGKAPYVTDYAATNHSEDFAESHAFYHMDAGSIRRAEPEVKDPSLQRVSPAKYQAMQQEETPNWFESIVAQKPFRDSGRVIGQWSSAVPYLRPAIGFMTQISIFTLATSGFQEAMSGVQHQSGREITEGLLDAGSGVGLAFTFANPLLGPAALACLGARQGLRQADADNASNAQATAAAAGGALGGVIGGIGGPLGGTLAGYAIGGPVGGAVGMLAGSFTGLFLGSRLGAQAGLALSGAH